MDLLPKQTEYLKQIGFRLNEEVLQRLDSSEKTQSVKESIETFLKDLFQKNVDTMSEHRKKGIDFFIEDLKLEQCKSKLKLATANYDLDDIKMYIKKINELESIIKEKVPTQSDQEITT